jgi:hypothetical protein
VRAQLHLRTPHRGADDPKMSGLPPPDRRGRGHPGADDHA